VAELVYTLELEEIGIYLIFVESKKENASAVLVS